jgi:DNA-binding transcriptional LysR family regulator
MSNNPVMLDLNWVRVFAKVAELRSMTAAARSLRMPKSSVSRDLAELEAMLGVRLLQRTTRRIGLTDAGLTFYPYCVRILSDAGEAEAAVSQLQAEPRGHLRVNVPIAFGQTLLGPLLADFVTRYPRVTVGLDLESRRIDVISDDVDVVIRVGALSPSSLIARRLLVGQYRLCASPAYVAAHGMPERPDDLAQHATVSLKFRDRVWRMQNAAGEHLDVPISPRIVVNDPATERAALLAGAGVGWLALILCADDIASGRLVCSDLAGWFLPGDDIHVLFPSNRSLSPKVRAFVDFLAEHFASAPLRERPIRRVPRKEAPGRQVGKP